MAGGAYAESTEVRLTRGWVPVGLLGGCALVVLARLSPLFDRPGAGVLVALALGAAGLVVLVATVRLGTLRRTGAVRLDAEGLWLDGARVLDGLREGDHVVRGAGAYVRLAGRQGTALVRVASRSAGEEALAAAGLAGRSRAYTVRKAGMAAGSVMGVFTLALVAAFTLLFTLGVDGAVIAAPLVGGSIALAVWQARRDAVTLRVGSDGLVLVEGQRAPRFLRYGEVASVELTLQGRVADGLILRLSDGTSHVLDVPSVQVEKRTGEVEEPARPLRERILEAKRAADAEGSATTERASVATTLDQGGRSTAEWVRDLRAALTAPASYRTAPVSRDALAAVLRDGEAGPRVRVAAAIALAAVEGDAVRVVAASCADEDLARRLRVAAMEAPSAELEAALDWADASKTSESSGAP